MISRSNRPWVAAEAARVGWTDEGTPVSDRFDDIYYSREDGLGESRHVFLQGNGLPARWAAYPGDHFTIAETGFGTGLNFLLSWQAWRESPPSRPRLHFISLEKYPLRRDDLARALAAWPSLAPLARQLLADYPGLAPGQHRLVLENGAVTLDLWWEDAADALPDLASRAQPWVDAWYLDGFAPARNESMWCPEHFLAMARLSREGASFATFTAAGAVRRGLAAAGFRVEKAPGYGRKRECLRGELQHRPEAPPPSITPWDLPSGIQQTPSRAMVVGAGLAGCHVARALAERGLHVEVLEAGAVAGEGSGNEQGILFTRLSRRHSALTDFALQSFCFASHRYRHLFDRELLQPGVDGDLCGSFQQLADREELAAMEAALTGVPDLARVVDAGEANSLLGIQQPRGGYWFPRSGWLHPPAVCRALLDHPQIELREDCGSLALQRVTSGWTASAGDRVLALSLIHISEPTRRRDSSRMPSSA